MSIYGRGEDAYQEALRKEFIRDVAKICREYERNAYEGGDADADEADSFIEIYDLMYEYGYIE